MGAFLVVNGTGVLETTYNQSFQQTAMSRDGRPGATLARKVTASDAYSVAREAICRGLR